MESLLHDSLSLLKERNNYQCRPFQTFFQWYATLLKENEKQEEKISRLLDVQGDTTGSPFNSSQPNDNIPANLSPKNTNNSKNDIHNRTGDNHSPSVVKYEEESPPTPASIQNATEMRLNSQLNELLLFKSRELRIIKNEVESQRSKITDQVKEIDELSGKIEELEEVVSANKRKIEELEKEKESFQRQYEKAFGELTEIKKEYNALVQRNLNSNSEYVSAINDLNDDLERLNNQIKLKNNEIINLQQQIDRMNNGELDTFDVIDAESDPSIFISQSSVLPSEIKFDIDQGHDREVNIVCFNHEGTFLYSGGADGKIQIWHFSTGRNKHVLLTNPKTPILCICTSSEYICAGGDDGSIYVWDARTFRQRLKWNKSSKPCTCIGLHDGGGVTRIIAAFKDRTFKIYNLIDDSSKVISTKRTVHDIALTSDGNNIIAVHDDRYIRTWDLTDFRFTGEKLITKEGTKPTSISIGGPGKKFLLVSVYSDSNASENCIKLLDIRNFKVITTFRHPNYRSTSDRARAVFSPSGDYVCAAGKDGKIYVWSTLASLSSSSSSTTTNDEVLATSSSSSTANTRIGGWKGIWSSEEGTVDEGLENHNPVTIISPNHIGRLPSMTAIVWSNDFDGCIRFATGDEVGRTIVWQ